MVDAMNFKSKSLAEINESNFITLYADEAEYLSHKDCFAMFVTYYSNKAQMVVTVLRRKFLKEKLQQRKWM